MARSPSVDIATLGLAEKLADDRPKGDQIREIMEDLASQLEPGATMPSDRQFAAHYGVARMTVRTEINQLVQDGVLEVERGRGTFVAGPPKVPYEWGASYSLSTAEGFGKPGSRLIERAILSVGQRLAETLEVQRGSSALRLVRLRTLDEEPVGIERVTIPLQLFPGLEELDLEQDSLYRLLEERWGLGRVSATGAAAAVLPSEEEAELLEIDLGDPCIAVRMTNRDASGRVFEIGRSIYRGDRYELGVNYGQTFATRRS